LRFAQTGDGARRFEVERDLALLALFVRGGDFALIVVHRYIPLFKVTVKDISDNAKLAVVKSMAKMRFFASFLGNIISILRKYKVMEFA
jgi:hypothetical protein